MASLAGSATCGIGRIFKAGLEEISDPVPRRRRQLPRATKMAASMRIEDGGVHGR
jgi:hypothetical protein